MSRRREAMVLCAYLSYGTGHHSASWRHPLSDPTASRSVDHYFQLAKSAEAGLFDAIFLADTPTVYNDDRAGFGGRVTFFEPLTLFGALSVVTSNIGLIATSSTTYKEPYNVAREYASLDLVSGGRAAWNLVTTAKNVVANNFGSSPHPPHDVRYRRAEEFVDIVRHLWDTWDDDAFVADRASGRFYDPERRHRTKFDGEFFDLDAELNVSRPPQGHPIIVQAGASEPGRRLAARSADVVFSAQPRIEDALAFARDMDRRTSVQRRLNKNLIIVPGLTAYAGRTRDEAKERFDELASLISPEFGLSMLSDLVGGFDLSACDVDGPLPELPPSNANTSRRALIEKMAYEERLTLRQIYMRMTTSRGHLTLLGSYDEIADEMAAWFESGAVDGFNVMPPLLPTGLDEFVEHIVPRLTSRGVFKSVYQTGVFREKLGLRRPNGRD